MFKTSINLNHVTKSWTVQQYLSSVSPLMPISSVTVAREQLSFLRPCFWLTGSAGGSGWASLHVSFSVLVGVGPLVLVEGACPLCCLCSLEPCASACSGEAANRLCLLMVFLRSLATFSAELFLFSATVCSSPTSSSEKTNTKVQNKNTYTQLFCALL